MKLYVKLRRKVKTHRFFCEYEIDDVSICQSEGDHFWPSILVTWIYRFVPKLERRLGGYVICKVCAQ